MIGYGDWLRIPWQKRNEIITFYGLGRSQKVKVNNEGVEDDGIREKDLETIAHLTPEEAIALKPLVAEPQPPTKQEVEPPKKVKAKKPNAKKAK